MQKTRAVAAVFLLTLGGLLLPVAPILRTVADPSTANNGDGTSDAVWNFTNAADYSLTNTAINAATVSLRQQIGWWNTTTGADFSGPDSATNVTWVQWPGDVALSTSSGPASVLTLQPGASGEDTWIDRNSPATNHGGDTTLILDGRNPESRPLLRFDLSSIPANVLIDNAALSLYESTGFGNNINARLRLLTASWVENQATWNERLTGTAWTTAGGEYNGKIVDQRTLDNTVGWRTWNATVLVDLWYRNRVPNYGLILDAPNPGANSDKTFYSSDYGVDPTLRPKLEIRYRILGTTGEYVSKVGGPGTPANWQTLSWNATDRSLLTDEFNGASLDSKWTWTNLPSAYDVGTTTPGSLHVVSSTGVDIIGATFTGNVLANEIVGNFTATMKFATNPTVNGQKAGLMALLSPRDWYHVGKQYVGASATVNWRVRSTVDSVTTTRVDLNSGNPNSAWVRIHRGGNSFTAYTSLDGTTWTLQDTYVPAFEYPLQVRLAFYAADGTSGTALATDVDYIRVVHDTDAVSTVQTRTGNVTPVDGTWTSWTAPYPSPSGSVMAGASRYLEYRLALGVTYPDHTPDFGDVNVSWASYVSSGTVETSDLVPGDVSQWGTFAVVHALNGQTIAYSYSTDSGGSWTPLIPPASLQAVSTATGKIRFQATFSTADATVTPALSELRLTYRHNLDHFYVTAAASATAGAAFSVTVTAKDTGNATISWWTGTVSLDARLVDGVTPGTGILGTTSLAISVGGTATLATETYTKAEGIRIRASFGSVTGLGDLVVISPGPLDHVVVSPNNITLLPFESQIVTAEGYDVWDNSIVGLAFTWSITGGVGTLNSTSGSSVNFTASPPPANGTIQASSGAIVGVAQIHVVSGVRPWVVITAPTSGAHITGIVAIGYTNSTDAVQIQFDYNGGAGWTPIGTTVTLNGSFMWNTSGLDFVGGSLRAIVANARTITNTTVVTPIEVDNTPPTISLGSVIDGQATTGTLTLTYATSTDVVRVNFSYFDGAWNTIGSDLSIDGSYIWTPASPINGVTVRALAIDDVGLRGVAEKIGIGNRTVGTNGPTVQAIPAIHVQTGTAYDLNLTFYVSDPDTPLSGLTIRVADPANVTASPGIYPSLAIVYATSGTHVVTLWVSDGTNTAWTLLTIAAEGTSPPAVVSPLPTVTFDEDTTATNAFGIPLTTYFTDLDGDTLSLTILGTSAVHRVINASAAVDLWADPNWNGIATLRVRAMDPNGGFAEAAFSVVVRAVNDPPVLAAIPNPPIESGTTYVLDLDPYISDVDTPLAAITVTTDSPYVTVNGHNLTLAFPSRWTGAEFNVTVSDGSLAATRTIQVTIHVTPAWWQAPYLLALPPIGVFVVIAMFAQRARWRPAKAFLVDDNGRMLREFTLDPSCQVTYDQAVQAGILDAVDKPIRVTKYHGQTVRGDALGVVLLAYGPVTLEHVEFAREMLVQIQDKFEEAVKQRLTEARAQEANVATQMDGLEARRAEVEARTAEVESMAQQAQAVQTKIAADIEAVEAKDRDLLRRENELTENRRAVDDLARHVEELQASFDRRSSEIQEQAADVVAKSEAVHAREEAATTLEETLRERDDALINGEASLRDAMEWLATDTSAAQARLEEAGRREEALSQDQANLMTARQKFEAEQKELLEFKRSIDGRVSTVEQREAAVDQLSKELEAREARIAPDEARLAERVAALDQKHAELTALEGRLTTRTQSLIAQAQDLDAREMTLKEDRVVLKEARGAFESDRKEFEERRAQHDEEVRRRQDDLDGQAKTVGESQLCLAQEKETFETAHTEKSQAILSREIELEAREQSLREKEDAVRAQAEENASRFGELAAREESLEIEAAKADQVRGDLDARKADLANRAAELEAEAARLRDAETKAAEERRTWQTTLQSEQALLKDQRDAFEQEAASARASWADRVMRIEAREVDLEEKEEKVRTDVDWVARTDEDLKRREKTVEEAGRSAAQEKATAERVAKEAEQRSLEIESRERALREEAAHQAIELTKQTEALKQAETDLASEQADFEKERAAQTQRLHETETDLQTEAQTLKAKARDLGEQESRIAGIEESFRQRDLRLQQERADVQATAKQLESRQLELAQLKDRYESEAARVRSEVDGMRQSVAAKEAELHAERERIERDSSALQETLGAKAKEMSVRERALTAREAELQAEEQELEARGRELESKERQAEAHLTELSAQAMALIRREQDLDARGTQLDQTVRRFESEATEKRREWESLQTSLTSQQAQFTATSESRTAELTKKTEELDGRERSQRAALAQLEVERSKLEAESKAQSAKTAEAEAAWRRSEARLAELKTKEDELLRGRQSFESERSTWSARRTEELKQLEATRDAAAQQAQQAERLVAESQRRALVAEEAERAAKRQTADLAAQQARLESRRSEAEKAERDAQGHLAQLQDASQKLAAKDMEIATVLKDLEARQVKLAASERDSAALQTELRSKKTALDQEAVRIAASSDQLTARQKDLESRTATLEAKMAQASTREQALATELQRADNLMEDLSKKEHDLRAREEASKASEKSLAAREATLVARDAEVRDGMRSLEKLRKEVDDQRGATEEDRRTAKTTREEAEATKREADKIRAQADEMQAEVNKNLRFLQKKALDVLDQEEKIRARVATIEGQEKSLDTRGEILEGKERALEADQAALDAKIAKLQAEIDRLRARLTETEKSGGPTTAAMEEWKKDVENRVKIIQKKAMDLLDREEKLRKKEEELHALASQLGVNP